MGEVVVLFVLCPFVHPSMPVGPLSHSLQFVFGCENILFMMMLRDTGPTGESGHILPIDILRAVCLPWPWSSSSVRLGPRREYCANIIIIWASLLFHYDSFNFIIHIVLARSPHCLSRMAM